MKTKPIKIAIFGAAQKPKGWVVLGVSPKEIVEKIGGWLGEYGKRIEILTGACVGVPDLVAGIAREKGARIIGYSGAKTLKEHLNNPNYVKPDRLDELKLLNPGEVILNGFAERSLKMIRDADALMYLGGRTGTLLEYCAAYDGCNKPMYVLGGNALRGSMGITDRVIYSNRKQRNGRVFVTDSHYDLINRLHSEFESLRGRR